MAARIVDASASCLSMPRGRQFFRRSALRPTTLDVHAGKERLHRRVRDQAHPELVALRWTSSSASTSPARRAIDGTRWDSARSFPPAAYCDPALDCFGEMREWRTPPLFFSRDQPEPRDLLADAPCLKPRLRCVRGFSAWICHEEGELLLPFQTCALDPRSKSSTQTSARHSTRRPF